MTNTHTSNIFICQVRTLVPPAGSEPGDVVYLEGGAPTEAAAKQVKSDDWKKIVEKLAVQVSQLITLWVVGCVGVTMGPPFVVPVSGRHVVTWDMWAHQCGGQVNGRLGRGRAVVIRGAVAVIVGLSPSVVLVLHS